MKLKDTFHKYPAIPYTLVIIVLFLVAMLGSNYIDGQRSEAVDRFIDSNCEFIVSYEGGDAYYRCESN